MLATKFGSYTKMDRGIPLSNEQLYIAAPSIFAGEKHESKSRIEGKSEFTKHMIRLRQQDQILAHEANEIILINSHDGTSSYQMLAGIPPLRL